MALSGFAITGSISDGVYMEAADGGQVVIGHVAGAALDQCCAKPLSDDERRRVVERNFSEFIRAFSATYAMRGAGTIRMGGTFYPLVSITRDDLAVVRARILAPDQATSR